MTLTEDGSEIRFPNFTKDSVIRIVFQTIIAFFLRCNYHIGHPLKVLTLMVSRISRVVKLLPKSTKNIFITPKEIMYL